MQILKPHISYNLPWRGLPGDLPSDIEVFAIGDIHGQADLLALVLDEIRSIPRAAHRRHLVFLGDLIDRGPASIRAVELAMGAKQLADADELHVLPGNHDLALLLALEDANRLGTWSALGGDKVMAEIGMSENTHSWAEISAKFKEVLNPAYLHAMTVGATHLYFGDQLFVHAGVHPDRDRAEFLDIDRRSIEIEYHWASIRYPFLSHTEGWDVRDQDLERRRRKPTVIIHGHTPAIRQDLLISEDLIICDGIEGHRTVALDIGAAYRPQLAYAHFRNRGGLAEVQISAVKICSS